MWNPLITLALLASLHAHFVQYSGPGFPDFPQKGIAVGTPRVDERLIFYFPTGNCKDGMKAYTGHYGDVEAAEDFLMKSGVCK